MKDRKIYEKQRDDAKELKKKYRDVVEICWFSFQLLPIIDYFSKRRDVVAYP